MTDLQAAAEQYLATRRAVGFKLTHVEPLLYDFVRFARSGNATHVTCDLALQWATAPQDATPGCGRAGCRRGCDCTPRRR